MSDALASQLALLPAYLSRHLLLSLTALAAGVGLSLPLAVGLAGSPRWRGPVLAVASAIQTIPGLALLALMVPLLRQIGYLPAVIALILYSMLPVLRNTVTGIETVDPDLIEAGRGLGMTDRQLLFGVQLPLAMPVIIAGIRTAAVWVVGMATLSTPVGATSLGNYIFTGLQTQNYTAVTIGCVAAAALALALDGLIRAIEVGVRRRRRGLLRGALTALAVLAGIGLWPAVNGAMRDAAHPSVVIGTKTFTEQYVLGEVIARVLGDAGFRTQTVDSLGSTVAFDALASGRIDAYVDYTGTIWANYMNGQGSPGADVMRRQVAEWLAAEHGIGIAARLGFENAYAFAMPRADAEALRIETVADLAGISSRLRLGGDYEFFARPEWAAVRDTYELTFRELVTMDSALMYTAAAEGQVDAIAAFSTDGRIPAFDLQVLDDTRGALPPYDALLLVRRDTPVALLRALAVLEGGIDDDVMRAANRIVDLDGRTVGEAAESIVSVLRRQSGR